MVPVTVILALELSVTAVFMACVPAAVTIAGAFGSDGHSLFTGRNGSPIWGPMIERYLAERGVSVR